MVSFGLYRKIAVFAKMHVKALSDIPHAKSSFLAGNDLAAPHIEQMLRLDTDPVVS
ncbi:hypothetical protein D3C75_1370160 [compost metagenome]